MRSVSLKRGEIWWAMLPAPAGKRPVIIISRDIACRVRNAVTVAEITRTIRNIPVEVKLNQNDGMSAEGVINVDTIFTLPKTLLEKHICTITKEKMEMVEKAIKFALNLKL